MLKSHTNKIINRINYLIEDIKTQEFEVDRIIVFGSAVRNQLHPNSDVDFCIVSKTSHTLFGTPEENEVVEYLSDMFDDLCEIDYVRCDLPTLKTGNLVFKSIREEGRLLWKHI